MSQSKSSAPSTAAGPGIHDLVNTECSKSRRDRCYPTAYQASEAPPSTKGLEDKLAVTMTFGLGGQTRDPGGQANWENRHAPVLQPGSFTREHFSSIIHKGLRCIRDDYEELVNEVPGTFNPSRQSIGRVYYWHAECERQPSASGQTVFQSSWTLNVWYDPYALRQAQLSKSVKSDKKGGSGHKKSKDKDRKPPKLDEWAQSKYTGVF